MPREQFDPSSFERSEFRNTEEWSGGAQLNGIQCVEIHVPRVDSSVSALLAGVPTGESISRSAFSGESVNDEEERERSGIFEGLLGQVGGRPRRYGLGGSNRVRESNRLSTRQLVARAGLWRAQFWLGFSGLGGLLGGLTWWWLA